MFDEQGDDVLVSHTLSGRMDAFTELARRHQDYAYSAAFGVLADYHLAHDVVQESLLAAYQDLPKLRDPSRFRSWLGGIVRHMAHRAFRELGRVNVLAEAVGKASGLADEPPRPDGLVEREERRQQVQAALRRLSGTNRQVVSLYYMDGLSYADVAKLVGVTKTVVQGRLQRAREQLRGDLGAFEKGLETGRLPADFAAKVERLLEAAASSRADRDRVSKRLLDMGVHAVPSLCEALDGDPRDSVRTLAGRVLCEIGDPRAVQPLLRLLYTHRGRGMQYWTSRGFQARRLLDIPGMRTCLLDTVRTGTDKGALWLAFGVLPEAGDDASIFDSIHDVFLDPTRSSWTRTQALTALCEIRPNAAGRVIAEAISQEDPRVQRTGVKLAVRHGLSPCSVAVCRRLFAETGDWEGRLCAARLLLGHGSEGKTSLDRFMRSGSAGERVVATLVLAEEGSQEAAHVMQQELLLGRRERRGFRAAMRDGVPLPTFLPPVLQRLARENPTQVGPLIEGLLHTGTPGIRVAAIKILSAQKGSAFLGELRVHVKRGGKIARTAVSEMVRLKEQAASLAEDMMASGDCRERRAAVVVLRRLGRLGTLEAELHTPGAGGDVPLRSDAQPGDAGRLSKASRNPHPSRRSSRLEPAG